jgi:hypothetical protein
MELGFDPNTTVTVDKTIAAAKNFAQFYDHAFDSEVSKPSSTKRSENQEVYDNDWERKSHLYDAKVRAYIAEQVAADYMQHFISNKPKPSITDPAVQGETYDVQAYNSLILQEQSLRGMGQISKDNNGFFDEHIKEQKEKLQKEKEKAKETLQSKLDAGEVKELPDGRIIAPAAYEGLDEKETQMQLDIDLGAQAKHAQLSQTALQKKFLERKLSDSKKGYSNYLEYKKYLGSVKSKTQTEEPAPNADPQPAAQNPTPEQKAQTPEAGSEEKRTNPAPNAPRSVPSKERQNPAPKAKPRPTPPRGEATTEGATDEKAQKTNLKDLAFAIRSKKDLTALLAEVASYPKELITRILDSFASYPHFASAKQAIHDVIRQLVGDEYYEETFPTAEPQAKEEKKEEKPLPPSSKTYSHRRSCSSYGPQWCADHDLYAAPAQW